MGNSSAQEVETDGLINDSRQQNLTNVQHSTFGLIGANGILAIWKIGTGIS